MSDPAAPTIPRESQPASKSATSFRTASDDSIRTPSSAGPAGHISASRAHSIAIITLAMLAGIYTLYFARAVLMPMTMGLVLASLLRPLVRFARRLRLPDWLSAGLLLLGVVCGFALGVVNLIDPAMNWINRAPEHVEAAGEKLQVIRQKLAILSEASEQVEQFANGEDPQNADEAGTLTIPGSSLEAEDGSLPLDFPPTADTDSGRLAHEMAFGTQPPASEKAVLVELRQPRLVKGMTYLSSTGSVLAGGLVTIVLAFFFLASGDTLVNNILRNLPKLHQKRNVVDLLRRIERGISSYLLTVTLVNIGLGLAVAVVMGIIGMPNPMLWGVMATLLNFVPYIGALFGVAVLFVVSVLTFDSLSFAFLPPILYWCLTAIEGCLVTPLLLGRSMSLNPIFVFITLIFWGWMWGIGGALLAVPILAVSKLTFDQFEQTRPIGTLLGGDFSNDPSCSESVSPRSSATENHQKRLPSSS